MSSSKGGGSASGSAKAMREFRYKQRAAQIADRQEQERQAALKAAESLTLVPSSSGSSSSDDESSESSESSAEDAAASATAARAGKRKPPKASSAASKSEQQSKQQSKKSKTSTNDFDTTSASNDIGGRNKDGVGKKNKSGRKKGKRTLAGGKHSLDNKMGGGVEDGLFESSASDSDAVTDKKKSGKNKEDDDEWDLPSEESSKFNMFGPFDELYGRKAKSEDVMKKLNQKSRKKMQNSLVANNYPHDLRLVVMTKSHFPKNFISIDNTCPTVFCGHFCIPENGLGFPLLGPARGKTSGDIGRFFPPATLDVLFNNLKNYQYMQATTTDGYVDDETNLWVPEAKEPIPTTSTLIKNLMESREETRWNKSAITNKNKFFMKRFLPTLALVVVFNDVGLPVNISKRCFDLRDPKESGEVLSTTLNYHGLCAAYNRNLLNIFDMLTDKGVIVEWDWINKSPKAVFKNISEIFRTMKEGICTTWSESKKGIFAFEVFYLWPLLMGTYAKRKKKDQFLSEKMNNDVKKFFLEMAAELKLDCNNYPMEEDGSLKVPLRSEQTYE